MQTRDEIVAKVVAAQRGDQAAFEALALRFRATALLIARQTGADRETAEDAVQDAFVVAHRSLSALGEPVAFGPWFATIVRNRARKLLKQRPTTLPLDEHAWLSHGPASPCGAAIAITSLPAGIREAMSLYYLQEWSAGEIAALLERPLTTVKWQLHAGRTLLRKRLGGRENLL
jgi:RNA polymerase sigma-70 factor (ECF subfamily)